MAVRFPETSSRYWGPSNTFVTKTEGTKYVTDQYTALLSSVWGLEEMEAERQRRRKVERMLSSGRMDRMVKSSSVLNYQEIQPRHSARPRYDPRTVVMRNAKSRNNQSAVNRLGVINGHRNRHPVHRPPHQRPIKRPWRPPHYKPPLFGFLMKNRRRQDVNRHLAPPSKPYRPPPQRAQATPRPPPPPPSKPPPPPGPAPSYRPQYLPPAQPTPYQLRMSSPQPLASRTAVISGSVLDPYALLALLGFLVFMFYIIYNFINNTGNGRAFSDDFSDSLSDKLIDLLQWQKLETP